MIDEICGEYKMRGKHMCGMFEVVLSENLNDYDWIFNGL